MVVIPGYTGIPQKMHILKYLLKRNIIVQIGLMVNQLLIILQYQNQIIYAKGGYILCSSKVYEMMKNSKFGKFLDLECPTIFKHNLKTSLYLFYNSQDKEIFDNLNIRLS